MSKQSKPGRPRKASSSNQDDLGFVPDFLAAVPETDNIYIYNNNMLVGNKRDIDLEESPQSTQDQEGKGPFSAKELIFLEKYLIEKESAIKAMKLAGYDGVTDRTLSTYARKIVIRYESWAGSGQKVFRQAGVGEVRLARECDKLLEKGGERTRLGAMEFAGKVLRASQEAEAGSGGVHISINIMQGPCVPGPGAPPLVQVQEDHSRAIPPPTRALQITK
jgi:hypothetical protein